jgi:hypothetical protein
MPQAPPVQPFRNITRPSGPSKVQAGPVQKPSSICLQHRM